MTGDSWGHNGSSEPSISRQDCLTKHFDLAGEMQVVAPAYDGCELGEAGEAGVGARESGEGWGRERKD